jgi:hypothetical protein
VTQLRSPSQAIVGRQQDGADDGGVEQDRERELGVRLAPVRTRLDVITSNQPFSGWGEIFGDDMTGSTSRSWPTSSVAGAAAARACSSSAAIRPRYSCASHSIARAQLGVAGRRRLLAGGLGAVDERPQPRDGVLGLAVADLRLAAPARS